MLKLVILRSLILGYLPSLFLLQVIECKRKNSSLRFFSFLVVWFLDETKCVLHADEWYLYLYCIYTWMKITHVLYIHTRDIYTHAVPMCKRRICMCREYTEKIHLHVLCIFEREHICVLCIHMKSASGKRLKWNDLNSIWIIQHSIQFYTIFVCHSKLCLLFLKEWFSPSVLLFRS